MTLAGRVLAGLGILCAVVGLLVVEGVSIEFPGIILGALGYYFGLRGEDRLGRILAIVALVLCVISIGVSGLAGGPQ